MIYERTSYFFDFVDNSCPGEWKHSSMCVSSRGREAVIDIRLVTRLLPITTDNKVTWLILPVVICLSQRLSHACLRINNFILWICERLIISAIIYLMVPYYMDNCSNSRANTCVKSRLFRGGIYLLDKKPMLALSGLWWIIVTFRMAWLHVGHISFKFLPYQLSTVV